MKYFAQVRPRITWGAASALLMLCLTLAPLMTPTTVAQDDATALLTAAAETMADVQSFHFEVSTPRGETQFAESLTLLELSGDVQRPDRFQATALVDAAIARLELNVIGIGTTIWVTDPLASEPSYIELGGGGMFDSGGGEGPSFLDMVNPDRMLLAAVGAVENPTIAGQDTIDGVTTTRINGTTALEALTGRDMSGTPMAGMTLSGEPLQVAIWIDEANVVRQLDIYGPLLSTEAPNTVRRLKLSAINEPIDIQPPENVSDLSDMNLGPRD